MHPIVYDVAIFIDGFIVGVFEDVSSFPFQGSIVEDYIKLLKQSAEGDIYLCGGGELATSLVKHQAIDILRLKRAPILLWLGIRLFGSCDLPINTKLWQQNAMRVVLFFRNLISTLMSETNGCDFGR
ncbi:MAG: hypothetical protein COB24_11350 [Hyphomicrobiales bacterium]|nr:MAG: hypothetical protein COB24_11350 [Hyphomicrobiales bacterium]